MSDGQPEVEVVKHGLVHRNGIDPEIGDAADTFRLAEVFGTSFAIFGRRFVPLVILTVIASAPEFATRFAIGTEPIATAGLRVLGMATQSLIDGAVMYAVVQELRGRAFSVGDSLRIALERFLPLLGVAVGTGIVIVLGMLLLVVPGLLFLCMFFVAVPVCVTERTGVFESVSRSSFLTEGYRWQVFGTVAFLLVVGLIANLPLWVAAAPIGDASLKIGSDAVGVLLSAFGGVVTGVLYYRLRVAKEGVDIDRIASVFD